MLFMFLHENVLLLRKSLFSELQRDQWASDNKELLAWKSLLCLSIREHGPSGANHLAFETGSLTGLESTMRLGWLTGEQTCTISPTMVLWILGTELMSLCLQNK